MENIAHQISRRWLLKAAPTAAAGLMIYSCAPQATASASGQKLNSFIEFTADGRTILTCPEAEMGQDVFTGLAKILADEIGLDWALVDVARAPHHRDFYGSNGGQNTGGSWSVRRWYQRLREMGARVRQAFLEAAAARLQVSAQSLRLEQSKVVDPDTNISIELATLLSDVAKAGLPETAPLKADADLRLIGSDVPRKDIPAKVTGQARYASDVRVPDMLFAAVKMIPDMLGDAAVEGLEDAKSATGVLGVERLGNAVAVVAKTWWAANQATQLLDVTPAKPSQAAQLDNDAIDQVLGRAITEAMGAPASDADTVQATYTLPYLAHMCMETMAATVSIDAGKAHVWVSTQSPSRFAMHTAKKLGIDIEQVTIENMFLGGGFGRKGTDLQALDQAIELAQRYGKPVQVSWDRQTDIVSDQFRPAGKFAFAATLADDKSVAQVKSASTAQSLFKSRLPFLYQPGQPELPSGGVFPYQAAEAEHKWVEADLPFSIGFWRSVAGSTFPFATESFVDEVAHKAGMDPLAYRLAHMEDNPRLRHVLTRVAEMADWERERPEGTGLGIGMFDEWGSTCAQIAEVSVEGEQLTVHKVWAALDCGRVVSPDIVRAQVMSAVNCGLSAALFGEIEFDGGQAQQTNFSDYLLVDMTRSPEVVVELVDSLGAPGGVGEIGTPPTAPAIANAIFAASGKRIRTLPLSKSFDV